MKKNYEKLVSGAKAFGIELSEEQLEKFGSFYDRLIDANQNMNLTAITEWKEVVLKHFLDSLSVIPYLKEKGFGGEMRIIDMGTGAGFPGVPLAICLPDCEFILADSLQKRVGFLEDVTHKLSLSNVLCVHGRAEDLGQEYDLRERFDLAVSRAVANAAVLSEYCLPFVKVGGTFIAYKTESVYSEAENGKSGIGLLGGVISDIYEFTLPGSDVSRSFLNIKKVSPTPEEYPRRAGVPSKKPL